MEKRLTKEEFLKDLWHPASEMPDKNRTCLVRVVYHPNHGMFQDEERIEQSSFHDFGWYDYDFKYIGTNYDLIAAEKHLSSYFYPYMSNLCFY